MRSHHLAIAATTAFAALASAATYAADIELEATSVSKGGANEFNVPQIVVTGADNRYTRIDTARLRFEMSARYRKGEHFGRDVATFNPGFFHVEANGSDSRTLKLVTLEPAPGTQTQVSLGQDWRKFSFAFEYQDPRIDPATKRARDPVALCNDLLKSKSGAARDEMLREGATLPLAKAYQWTGNFHYIARPRGRTFDEPGDIRDSGYFPASVRCQNLVGPAPRTRTQTKGPPPRHGKPLSETSPIRSATLRIEPSSDVAQARPGQLCPTSLRVYAAVAAGRAFRGRGLVFGTGFISPPTALQFNAAGNRNFIVTYPLKWTTRGAAGMKANAPTSNAAPLSQSLHLTLNVVDGDDKVIATSGRKTFDVVCKRLPPSGAKTN